MGGRPQRLPSYDNEKMKSMPLIKSVMTPFPYCIERDQTLDEASAMMAEHDVRHLPVMEHGDLVGVIADSDIKLRRNAATSRRGPAAERVGDVCDMRAYVVELSTPLDKVLQHMSEHHIGCTLVVKGGRLAGIFTTTDACRHYGALLRTLCRPAGGNDAA
jgi:acetoin utilization protein AcuB